MVFKDRKEAGVLLAEKLKGFKGQPDVIVLALPRGGVVTGFEVARSIGAPLDVLIVRKIGFPGQEELAIGAVSETGTVVLNRNIIDPYHVSEEYIKKEVERQKGEIARRIDKYRGGKSLTGLGGKTVILVDDGVATGATIKAAIETLKHERIKKLVIALPVAPPGTARELEAMADKFICLETPEFFMAVGSFYHDFRQVEDEEVVEMLRKSQAETKTH